MAIAFANLGTAIATSTSTTLVVTLTTSVPKNAHIVLGCCDVTTGTAGITSPSGAATDTAGNTYTAIATQLSASTKVQGQFFIATAATSLSSGNTITYTRATGATTAASRAAISACVVTGISTTIASGIDTGVNATATTSSSTPTLVSGTPLYAGDAFISYLVYGSPSAIPTITRGSSWVTPPSSAATAGVSTNATFSGGHFVATDQLAKTWDPTVTAPTTTGTICLGVIALISSTSVLAVAGRWKGGRMLLGMGI